MPDRLDRVAWARVTNVSRPLRGSTQDPRWTESQVASQGREPLPGEENWTPPQMFLAAKDACDPLFCQAARRDLSVASRAGDEVLAKGAACWSNVPRKMGGDAGKNSTPRLVRGRSDHWGDAWRCSPSTP